MTANRNRQWSDAGDGKVRPMHIKLGRGLTGVDGDRHDRRRLSEARARNAKEGKHEEPGRTQRPQ
jgi:hypothetical protein